MQEINRTDIPWLNGPNRVKILSLTDIRMYRIAGVAGLPEYGKVYMLGANRENVGMGLDGNYYCLENGTPHTFDKLEPLESGRMKFTCTVHGRSITAPYIF